MLLFIARFQLGNIIRN